MQGLGIWRLAQALLLGAALVAVIATTGPVAVGDTPIVHAGVAQSNDNDDRRDRGNDDDEDHNLNGQVLEINTLKDPPELILATTDGAVVVRVFKTDEIALNGVGLGDHITAKGEKIHEQLFEATELSVAEHYRGGSSADAPAGSATATPVPTATPAASPTAGR